MKPRQETHHIVLCTSDTDESQDIGLKDLDRRDRSRGYFRCVFHFVIRRNGTIEHGHRPFTEYAMSLGRHNATSVSICMVGGRDEQSFTADQVESLRALVTELRDEYPQAEIVSHSDLNPRIAPCAVPLLEYVA